MKLKSLKHRLGNKKLAKRKKTILEKKAREFYERVLHRVTVSEILLKVNRY